VGNDSIDVINAILPGKVIKVEHGKFFSVTIYHGDNLYSKTSGIAKLSDYVQPGRSIIPDSILGTLPPQSTNRSPTWRLEVTRNGKAVSGGINSWR
jgi:hypothetical protein